MLSNNGETGDAAVINHLLEVEKEANELIARSQEEADKRTADYKARAEEAFKAAHDAAVSEMEMAYKEQTESIKKAHDNEIAAYKKSMEEIKQDRRAFNEAVTALIARE